MSKRLSLTAIFEPVESGWTQARIEEIPAVITAAPTAEEARELLLDALGEYLLSLRQAPAHPPGQPTGSRQPLVLVLGA